MINKLLLLFRRNNEQRQFGGSSIIKVECKFMKPINARTTNKRYYKNHSK